MTFYYKWVIIPLLLRDIPGAITTIFRSLTMQNQNTRKQSMLIAVRGLYVLATVAIVAMSLSVMSGH